MQMQAFHTQFTLSREYLAECFDESLPYGGDTRRKYLFAGVSFTVGALLLYLTDYPKGIGTLLIVLAIIELVHIRFKRAWWLTRQIWGRSGNSEIKLSIDDKAIQTQNPYTKTVLLWKDVERIIETDLGLILVAKSGGQQYLSKSLFTGDLVTEILKLRE
jgi:hypothetical protein